MSAFHRTATLRALLAATTGLLLAAPLPSSAWGPLGHQAVGAVADARLSPHAKSEVALLLANDLGRNGAPSGRTTLAAVSVWADEIRGSEADHPRWHYDNMPVCGAAPAAGAAGWCMQGECASARLGELLSVLADRRRPELERNEALKWIVHLVGDLHQPLHAADFAEGGTQVPVELAGSRGHPEHKRALTLHGAWDVRLPNAALHAGRDRQPDDTAVQALQTRAGQFDPAQIRAPPARWLAESNALARDVALDYPGFACDRVPQAAVTLSRAYQQRAQRVILERLALAGARLAYVVNRALE